MAQGRHRKRSDQMKNRQVGRVTSAVGVAAFIAASAGAANAAPVSAHPGHGSSKAKTGSSSASGQGATKSGNGATKAKSRADHNHARHQAGASRSGKSQAGGTHGGKADGGKADGGKAHEGKAHAGGTHAGKARATDTAPQPDSGRSYTVLSGDTLSEIAGRFDVSWQQLCEANRLDDCDLIFPGQELTISGVSQADSGGGAGTGSSRTGPSARSAGSAKTDAGGQGHDHATHQVSRASRSSARGDSCAQPDTAESWIIERESGGSVHADNPTSSAFGLGQLLLSNRQHYASRLGVSADTTDYCDQLKMFRMYVADRYGSAESARSFWLSHSWY
jgi:LysM repeat protein